MAKNWPVLAIVFVNFVAGFAAPSNTTDKYSNSEADFADDLQFYQQTRPGHLLFASCNEDRRRCSSILPPYSYENLFQSECFKLNRNNLTPTCKRLMAQYIDDIYAPENENNLDITNEQVQIACGHDLPLVCPEIIPPYTVKKVLDTTCLQHYSNFVSEECSKLYSFYQIYSKSKVGRLIWSHPYIASVGSLCVILAGIAALGLVVRQRSLNNYDYHPEYNLMEEGVDFEELIEFPSTDLPAYSKDDPNAAAFGQEDADQETEGDYPDLHSLLVTQPNGYHAVAINQEDSDELQ